MVPLLVLAGQVHAQQAADTSAFLIPRDQLATQDSDPFMLAGRVMDETRPRWAEFEDTLAAFPDTSSCLLPEERGKDVQNLLAFDWKAMRHLRAWFPGADRNLLMNGYGVTSHVVDFVDIALTTGADIFRTGHGASGTQERTPFRPTAAAIRCLAATTPLPILSSSTPRARSGGRPASLA
jgi:hypothetical protein